MKSNTRSGVLRTLPIAVAVGIFSLAVAACSETTSTQAQAQRTDSPGVVEAVPQELPDGVPMLPGFQLAAPSIPMANAQATGWTAVATTPTGTSSTETATQVAAELRSRGWLARVTSAGQDTFGIAAEKELGVKNQWLNITVTGVLPTSGPAVTYRYVVGLEPRLAVTR